MRFGMKYMSFKKKAKKETNPKELTIDRMHIVNAVSQYLTANSLWDDGKEITNIQFSDLFGPSTVEFCKLKIFYKKGGVK